MLKILRRTGFEPRTSGIGSDRSASLASTTAQVFHFVCTIVFELMVNEKVVGKAKISKTRERERESWYYTFVTLSLSHFETQYSTNMHPFLNKR